MKILIMGLPGTGKTTLAKQLNVKLHSKWYNADDVRESENDWDFSVEGRQRQALRMRTLAEDSENYGFKYVICDFVAPTEEIRNIFDANFTIWMNTKVNSLYPDTDLIFEKPNNCDIRIKNFSYNVDEIVCSIIAHQKF